MHGSRLDGAELSIGQQVFQLVGLDEENVHACFSTVLNLFDLYFKWLLLEAVWVLKTENIVDKSQLLLVPSLQQAAVEDQEDGCGEKDDDEGKDAVVVVPDELECEGHEEDGQEEEGGMAFFDADPDDGHVDEHEQTAQCYKLVGWQDTTDCLVAIYAWYLHFFQSYSRETLFSILIFCSTLPAFFPNKNFAIWILLCSSIHDLISAYIYMYHQSN